MGELRLPPQWRTGRFRVDPWRAGGMLVMGVLFTCIAVFGSDSRSEGMSPAGLVAGLMGLAALLGFVMTLRQAFPGSSTANVLLGKGPDGGPVLRIRQSRARQLVTAAILAVAAATGVLVGCARLAAGGLGIIDGVLLLGSGIVCSGMLAITIACRAPLDELVLGPRTVRLRTMSHDLSTTWDAVTSVDATKSKGWYRIVVSARSIHEARAPLSWPWRRRPRSWITVYCQQFAVAPALLFHLLRYYHLNPDDRAELGTPAALERVRTTRFTRDRGES